VVLSIVGYILYLVINKIKQEKEIAEFSTRLTSLRNQALQSQLNPHFIFNALNSIQEVVLSGDSKGAGIYLNKFARLLRRILEYSGIDTISLTEELKTIELYLEVESLRFSNEFNWEVQLEEDLDTDDFLIPPLLLQPIVENAIWHGLRQKPGSKVITIDIALLQTQLSIGITDNGVGFNSDEPKPATQHKKKSLGISFTKERLSVYDAQQGTVSTMDISPSVTGGTQVLLLIGQSWLLTEK
jgi:LytS/YehU family sensor histidine kinase